ncbi:MAG: hypothetical protein ACK4Z5_06080 [Brevundimonas sp.]
MHDESRELIEGLRLTAIAVVCAVMTAGVVIGLSQILRPPPGASLIEVSVRR